MEDNSVEQLFKRYVWHELILRDLVSQKMPDEIVSEQKALRESVKIQLCYRLEVIRKRLIESLVEQQLDNRESAYCEGCCYSLKKRDDGTHVQVGDSEYDSNYCEQGMRKDENPRFCPFFCPGDWVDWKEKETLNSEKVLRLEKQYLSLDIEQILRSLLNGRK